MKQRDFLLAAALMAPSIPHAIAEQSATKKRLAVVNPSVKLEDMDRDPYTRIFFDELKRLGYVEGENLIVERYSGEARLERYETVAHEVVDTNPDVIATIGTPMTRRFKAATSTIPIVTMTGDP